MAKYDITSPTGEKFEVEAPDNATEQQVLEFAQQQFAQMSKPQEAKPEVTSDVIKSAASAPLKAASNLVGAPSSAMELLMAGARAGGNALGLDTRFAVPTFPNLGDMARSGFEKLGLIHKPQTTQGRYAGAAVEGALTAPGNPSMLISGAGSGIGAEAGGDIGKQHGPGSELAGRFIGGIAGGVAAGRAVKPLENTLNQEQQAVVQRAKDMGMKLTPGQQTGNRRMLALESTTESMPGGGMLAQQRGDNVKRANQIALKAVGEAGDEITPEVLSKAATRIGGEFDRLTQGRQIKLDKQFFDDVDNIIKEQKKLVEPDFWVMETLQRWQKPSGTANIAIPSDVYQANRSVYAADVRRGFQSDAGTQEVLAKQGLLKALDRAAERSLSGKDLADFKQARQQWANLEAVEASANAKTGYNVNPNQLYSALQRQNKKISRIPLGDRDLVDLSRMSSIIKDQVPNSGTPERQMWMSMLTGGLGGAGGYAAGGPAGAAAGVLAASAVPAVVQRGLMAPVINPYLSQGLLKGYERAPLSAEAIRAGLLAQNPSR